MIPGGTLDVRNYVQAAGAQGVQAVLTFVVIGALARLLAPAEFGFSVLMTSLASLAAVGFAAGVQGSVLIRAAEGKENVSLVHGDGLLVAACSAVVVGIIGVVEGENIAALLGREGGGSLVLASTLRVGPVIYCTTVLSVLSGSGRIRAMASVTLAGAALGLIAPASAALMPDSLAGAVWGSTVGGWVWACCALLISRGSIGLNVVLDRQTLSRIRHVAVPLHVGTIAYWAMLRSDLFLVNAIAGSSVAGIYALAASLAERVALVTTPAYNALAWRIAGSDRGASRRAVRRLTWFDVGVGALLVTVAWVFAPNAIAILGGTAYLAAAGPFVVLVAGSIALAVWSGFGLYLVSQLRGAWLSAWIQMLVAVGAIGGYLLVIPMHGAAGAATVSAFAYWALASIGGLAIIRSRRTYTPPVGAS